MPKNKTEQIKKEVLKEYSCGWIKGHDFEMEDLIDLAIRKTASGIFAEIEKHQAVSTNYKGTKPFLEGNIVLNLTTYKNLKRTYFGKEGG